MITKKRKFWRHQLETFEWAKQRAAVGLFLEMRLGKTMVGIRWTEDVIKNYYRIGAWNPKQKLVVAPLSVVPVWLSELRQEGKKPTALHGTPEQRLVQWNESSSSWFVTNYEGLWQRQTGRKNPVPSLITQVPWSAVLLDESTRIKNPQAHVTKNCLEAFANVRFKAILTGLPDPESSLDFFEQMRFLFGSFLGCHNYWEFRKRYYSQIGYDWVPKKETPRRIKNAIAKSCYVLSQRDAGIENEKIRERRYCQMPRKLLLKYREVEREWVLDNNFTKWIIVVRVFLAKLSGGNPKNGVFESTHKIKEVLELLRGELKREQSIIWFRFNTELFAAENYLNKRGIKTLTLTGKDNVNVRARKIKKAEQGNCQALLVQTACGRFGLNLSFSSTSLYYSNYASLEMRKQSEERVVFVGKKTPNLYVDFLSQGTVDEDIVESLAMKNIRAKYFIREIWKRTQRRIRCQEKR